MDQDPSSQRQVFLAIFLTGLAAGGFGVLLVIISGGLLLYALAVVAGIIVLGYVNYLLWGRSMSREVTEEQQHEEAPGEQDDWPYQEWQDPRRF